MDLHLPAQSAVDRSEVLRPPTTTITIVDADGTVLKVLEVALGGDYGGVPADPAWVGPSPDGRRRPRTA